MSFTLTIPGMDSAHGRTPQPAQRGTQSPAVAPRDLVTDPAAWARSVSAHSLASPSGDSRAPHHFVATAPGSNASQEPITSPPLPRDVTTGASTHSIHSINSRLREDITSISSVTQRLSPTKLDVLANGASPDKQATDADQARPIAPLRSSVSRAPAASTPSATPTPDALPMFHVGAVNLTPPGPPSRADASPVAQFMPMRLGPVGPSPSPPRKSMFDFYSPFDAFDPIPKKEVISPTKARVASPVKRSGSAVVPPFSSQSAGNDAGPSKTSQPVVSRTSNQATPAPPTPSHSLAAKRSPPKSIADRLQPIPSLTPSQ